MLPLLWCAFRIVTLPSSLVLVRQAWRGLRVGSGLGPDCWNLDVGS